ncbi:MAG TPA: hypothetical protein VF136_06995 [Methylomirabilota bacterium]
MAKAEQSAPSATNGHEVTKWGPAWIALAVLVLLAVASAMRWSTPGNDAILATDEADYVRAFSYGAAANYLGTRERSGFAFVADVWTEYRRTGWARPFQRDWDAGDAAGLRHYHPPFSMYPLGILAAAGERDERTLRLVPGVTGVLATLAAAWLAGVLLLGVRADVRWLGALAAGMLAATSEYLVLSSATLSFHAAFSLLSTLTLGALVAAVQTGRRTWWLGACALLGLTTLTVPYWALLLPGVLFVWWWGLPVEYSRLRAAATGLAAAALAMFVAWPPALLQLGLVKPVLMYAGIIVRPLGSRSEPGGWMLGLAEAHPALLLLGVAGLASLPSLRRPQVRALAPVVLFAAGFFVLNLRVSHMKALYASDVVAPLAALAAALAAFAILRLPCGFARPAALLLPIVAVLQAGPALAADRSDQGWRDAIASLNRELEGDRVLVTPRAAGAMVLYYVPAADVVLDSNHPDDVPALRDQLADGRIDVVLRWGSRVERRGAASPVVSSRDPDGRVVVAGTRVSWWRVGR